MNLEKKILQEILVSKGRRFRTLHEVAAFELADVVECTVAVIEKELEELRSEIRKSLS